MNSGVRIIKRDLGLQSPPLSQHEKTARQTEREIAGTVKNWIVELNLRRRADDKRLSAVLNSREQILKTYIGAQSVEPRVYVEP